MIFYGKKKNYENQFLNLFFFLAQMEKKIQSKKNYLIIVT